MYKFKMLSGEELVNQGAKKVNSSLPELGLKDIVPNGSWLEQKQIQNSLEARRHIIEVERIEKCGSLSQADWNEELQLAEVTKNTGGHWQYVGHNIGRQLYLYPEEALYLMEVSCLQLKYNDVTVSIQQAYSLLLKDNSSLIKYKAYASLSRLGYKVFRHTYVKANDSKNDETENKLEDSSSTEQTSEETDISKRQVENMSMNKKLERDDAKKISNISDCKMMNISNAEMSDSSKYTEKVDNATVLKSETLNEVTGDITENQVEAENKKEQAICTKVSDDIADCLMKDISNEEKLDVTENPITANTKEPLSSGSQASDITCITEEQQGNKDKKTKIVEITDCLMKHISDEQKCVAKNEETTEKVKQPISEHTREIPNITESQVENKDMVQILEDNSSKDRTEILGGQTTNSFIVENVDTTENSNQISERSNKHKVYIETITTDNKAKAYNLNNIDIVPKIELIDKQSSFIDIKENSKPDDCEIIFMETEYTDETRVSSSVNLCDDDCKEPKENVFEISRDISKSDSAAIIQNKIQMLTCRVLKPSNSDIVHNCIIENLPDFYQKQIVTVKAPDEQLIPRNVFLNNTAYVLNLENLKLKSVTPAPSSSSVTYVSDEANEQHVRRIRSGYSNERNYIHFNPQFFPNLRFSQPSPQYRPFNYWNQYHWTYQRPSFFANMPFRFQFFPRMQPMFRCITGRSIIPNFENTDSRRARKRKRDNPKVYHLESIKRLAQKLKSLVASGNRQEQNIQALQRLIDTYNVRYKARIELTAQLEILENEIILETIDLDDDDQSHSKKKKRQDMKSYDENFNAMKQFSSKIKELEVKKLLTTRHKRAFSNVVKTFNKSYNADVYVNSNYEVIDRRRIVIDSSSDSECAVEEIQTTMEDLSKPRKCRKLRNPFYILKQLSEKQSPSKTSQEMTGESSPSSLKKKVAYSDHLKKMFSKYWLPSEDDFGRAEVPLKSQLKEMDHSEEYLYEFIKSQPVKFKNWLDAKIAYWQSCEETACKYEAQTQNESNLKLVSIIKPEDCTDLGNVLKKLGIIKTKKDIEEECSLNISFDVYNRDVPNFKKTKKPTPHFRVVCIAESSTLPSGADFATLHSKYEDNVAIIFAIVGPSSISYLQMNPVDLPIYLPTNNLP